MADFLQQLAEQKRKVDFNTYDMTTKELVSLVADGHGRGTKYHIPQARNASDVSDNLGSNLGSNIKGSEYDAGRTLEYTI